MPRIACIEAEQNPLSEKNTHVRSLEATNSNIEELCRPLISSSRIHPLTHLATARDTQPANGEHGKKKFMDDGKSAELRAIFTKLLVVFIYGKIQQVEMICQVARSTKGAYSSCYLID